MFAKVFIIEREAKDVLVIPADAIMERGVFVLRGGNAKIVSVDSGIAVTDIVQILSGVSSGDLVIVSGGNTLKDGDPVSAEVGKKRE
jgi:multidrug efflux pump subunit AcrA (membrane-fusion protein)